jgi:hypothetical protein
VYFYAYDLVGTSSVQFQFFPLGITATRVPPVLSGHPTSVPMTGMTLLALVGIFGFDATFTHARNNDVTTGTQCRVAALADGAFWFEGTYHTDLSWWTLGETCAHPSALHYGASPGLPYTPYDPDDTTAHPTPTILNITPSHGAIVGGTDITIRGDGFGEDATVTLDGLDATAVDVVDASTIQCTTPAHAAGAVTVVVTNPDGVSS